MLSGALARVGDGLARPSLSPCYEWPRLHGNRRVARFEPVATRDADYLMLHVLNQCVCGTLFGGNYAGCSSTLVLCNFIFWNTRFSGGYIFKVI